MTDDLSHMHNLRPLDFSGLLNYNEFAQPSRANPDTLMSPFCSASAQRSPALGLDNKVSSLPFVSGSPYSDFFSPLGTPNASRPWDFSFPNTTEKLPSDCTVLTDNSQPEPSIPDFCSSVTLDTLEQMQSNTKPSIPKLAQPSIAITVAAGLPASNSLSTAAEISRMQDDTSGPVISRNASMNIPVQKKVISKPSASQKTDDIEKKIVRKQSATMSNLDKVAERRRKNRESSSRCYYNRKRIIEKLDKQISAEKTKLTMLYDRALELRHENAKLKKDVVTMGIALPTTRGTAGYSSGPPIQFRGFLELLQSTHYSSFR